MRAGRAVARARRGEKGGGDAAPTIGPEATGHRPQRGELVTEALGDLLKRFVIDADRAKGLVLALEGLLRFEEKPPGVAPVHRRVLPGVDYFLARNHCGAYRQNRG
jgi:hypothetical protein